jgi:hypothetical protein
LQRRRDGMMTAVDGMSQSAASAVLGLFGEIY